MTDTGLTFAEMLELLGFTDTEFVSVCHRPVGGSFSSSVVKAADGEGVVGSLPEQSCVYFSVNAIAGPERHQQGRGCERDVTRWTGPYLDCDVKPGAFESLEQAWAFIDVMSGLIGTRPVAVIYSGHGLQPLWAITDGKLTDENGEFAEVAWSRAYRDSRRFKRLAHKVAMEQFGARLDNVADLSHVLRVPQTTNWKNPKEPVPTYAVSDTGAPLAGMDAVEEFLDLWDVPALESDTPVPRNAEVLSAPEGWQFGAANCPYVVEMIVPWDQESDRPRGGRHQWAMDRAVRLACAHRLGCLKEDGLKAAQAHLGASLAHWCRVVGEPRGLHPDEIGDAYRWAKEKVATYTDERTRKELGDHHHKVNGAEGFRKAKGGNDSQAGQTWRQAGGGRDDFWNATDVLKHIRDFARARRVSPWAVLGVELARVVCTVAPTVQIPPYIGGRASLNLFVGLIGPSGKGKGGPERAARDAIRMDGIYTSGPGSGEGVNHLFAHYDKDLAKSREDRNGTVFDRESVYFSVPEVDTLASLANRNGSTLLSHLCKVFSGESLTFGYVDRTKHLIIPEHSYRLGMVVGIQTGRAGALLDATDGGVPQRFVWLPSGDPDIPDVRPEEPPPLDYLAPAWSPLAVSEIRLPPEAAAVIDRNRVATMRGEGADSALDGHLGLCRIKVAAALALLHRCREITWQHWELSGVVMEVSQETRSGVEAELARKAERQNRARGRAEGARAVEAEEVKEEAAIRRVAQATLRKLKNLDGEATKTDARPHARDRTYYDPALERLEGTGQIEIVSGEHGEVIRLTDMGWQE